MVKEEMFLRIFKVLLVGTFVETVVEGDACTNYTILSNATRSMTYYDRAQPYLCDKNLETKWFRFEGQAGNRMQDYCPTGKQQHCQTFLAGWLNGTHPRVLDGEVDRKVCFRYYHGYYRKLSCCSLSSSVKVKNCGDRYYVYKLDFTRISRENSCARYCGTGVGK